MVAGIPGWAGVVIVRVTRPTPPPLPPLPAGLGDAAGLGEVVGLGEALGAVPDGVGAVAVPLVVAAAVEPPPELDLPPQATARLVITSGTIHLAVGRVV